MKRLAVAVVWTSSWLAACDGSMDMADMTPAPMDDPAFQLGMEFDSPPGTEVWKCRILPPLDVRGVANVNRVWHAQSAVVHHMDVMVLVKSGIHLPPGDYDCADLYRDYPALMEDTNIYACFATT